jgi:hypothetical protein
MNGITTTANQVRDGGKMAETKVFAIESAIKKN